MTIPQFISLSHTLLLKKEFIADYPQGKLKSLFQFYPHTKIISTLHFNLSTCE